MSECHICASMYCSKCVECELLVCDGCVIKHYVKSGHRGVVTGVAS